MSIRLSGRVRVAHGKLTVEREAKGNEEIRLDEVESAGFVQSFVDDQAGSLELLLVDGRRFSVTVPNADGPRLLDSVLNSPDPASDDESPED